MKKLYLILLSFIPLFLFSQTYLQVHKTDGSTLSISLADISKLDFSNLNTIKDVQKLTTILNTISVYPNPSTNAFTINYQINEASEIHINFYNQIGSLIDSKIINHSAIGKYLYHWDFSKNAQCSSGFYYCTVSANNQIITNKLLIIK